MIVNRLRKTKVIINVKRFNAIIKFNNYVFFYKLILTLWLPMINDLLSLILSNSFISFGFNAITAISLPPSCIADNSNCFCFYRF